MDYYVKLAKAQEAIEAVRATMENPQEVKPLLVLGDMSDAEFAQLQAQLAPQIEAELKKREEWLAAKAAREAAAAEAAGIVELEVEVVPPEPDEVPEVEDGLLIPIEDKNAAAAAQVGDGSEYAVLQDEPEAEGEGEADEVAAEAEEVADEPAEPQEEPEPEWDFPVVADKHVLYFRPHVQEMPDACWHYAGKLPEVQMDDVVGKVKLIHRLGTMSSVSMVDRAAERQGIVQDVLLELNTTTKGTAKGIPLDQMKTIRLLVDHSKHIRVLGLSCPSPFNPDAAKAAYEGLVAWRDENREDWEKLDNVEFKFLSFGSKDDIELAINCGSNFITF